MIRKILVVLIVSGCLLGWSSSVFAYDLFFETINLDPEFKTEFGDDILLSFGLDSYTGEGQVRTFFYGVNYKTLNDDGNNGDIIGGDDEFTFMCPYPSLTDTTLAVFTIDGAYVHGSPFDSMDYFNGNDLTPATVTATTDLLVWDSVTDADSYWVGVWDTGHSFYHDGEVDFSGRLKDFGLDATLTDTFVENLKDYPELTEGQYTYGIFAMGDGFTNRDRWSAAKGTLTVTPEPMSCLLFLLGGISLVFFVKRKKRQVLA